MASFSASEPSHQWTRAGLVRAAICSTQATRPAWAVGAGCRPGIDWVTRTLLNVLARRSSPPWRLPMRGDHAMFQVRWHPGRRKVNRCTFRPPGRRRARRRRTFPVADRAGERYRSLVQTLDPQTRTPAGALSSPATARNTAPILGVLKAHLPAQGRVLE